MMIQWLWVRFRWIFFIDLSRSNSFVETWKLILTALYPADGWARLQFSLLQLGIFINYYQPNDVGIAGMLFFSNVTRRLWTTDWRACEKGSESWHLTAKWEGQWNTRFIRVRCMRHAVVQNEALFPVIRPTFIARHIRLLLQEIKTLKARPEDNLTKIKP